MAIEIRIDGELVELPPRRAEMIRQLIVADLAMDLMPVGAVEFWLTQEKVAMRRTESGSAVRVLRWSEWRSAAIAATGAETDTDPG